MTEYQMIPLLLSKSGMVFVRFEQERKNVILSERSESKNLLANRTRTLVGRPEDPSTRSLHSLAQDDTLR